MSSLNVDKGLQTVAAAVVAQRQDLLVLAAVTAFTQPVTVFGMPAMSAFLRQIVGAAAATVQPQISMGDTQAGAVEWLPFGLPIFTPLLVPVLPVFTRFPGVQFRLSITAPAGNAVTVEFGYGAAQ